MTEIIEKLKNIKDEILRDKGGLLRFFGLLARMDVEGKWDLLISANWIEKNTSEADLVYVINKLKDKFSNKLDFLFRIVLLTPDEPFISQLVAAINRENGGQAGELTSLKLSETFHVKQVIVIALDSTGIEFAALEEVPENIGPVGTKEITDF